MHDLAARPQLRRLLRQAISQEAPVHEERILRTVREAWGLARSGSRIRSAFDEIIQDLIRHREVHRDHSGFLRTPGQTHNQVRLPGTDPATHRPINHIPPEELDTCVLRLTTAAHGITRAELRVHLARLFGWARTGPDITTAIDQAVNRTITAGHLHEHDSELRLTTP